MPSKRTKKTTGNTVRQTEPAVPNRLDIKIGFQCNNMCRFCVQGNRRYCIPQPQFAELKETLRAARRTCDSVVFTGGEPAIKPEFLELVRTAADLGYNTIQVQTNGRAFAYPDFCRETVAAGATEFSPALHGHIEELHDYLTRVPGSFRESVAGILNMKKTGRLIITNTVVTRSNFRHLPNIARLLMRLGVDQFQFAFVHAMAWAGLNFWSVVPRMSLTEPFLKKGLDVGLEAGVSCFTEAVPFCFMRGYETCIAEREMPVSKIVAGDEVIENYKDFRLKKGKLKGPPCVACTANAICEGPWMEYPKRYGWSEFIPV